MYTVRLTVANNPSIVGSFDITEKEIIDKFDFSFMEAAIDACKKGLLSGIDKIMTILGEVEKNGIKLPRENFTITAEFCI
jgi:hypothetical protein